MEIDVYQIFGFILYEISDRQISRFVVAFKVGGVYVGKHFLRQGIQSGIFYGQALLQPYRISDGDLAGIVCFQQRAVKVTERTDKGTVIQIKCV